MNQLRIGFFEITYKFFQTYIFLFAGMEGFEPPSTVLETAILPLNYIPMMRPDCRKAFNIQPPAAYR